MVLKQHCFSTILVLKIRQTVLFCARLSIVFSIQKILCNGVCLGSQIGRAHV